jgi:hypothetical protein
MFALTVLEALKGVIFASSAENPAKKLTVFVDSAHC